MSFVYMNRVICSIHEISNVILGLVFAIHAKYIPMESNILNLASEMDLFNRTDIEFSINVVHVVRFGDIYSRKDEWCLFVYCRLESLRNGIRVSLVLIRCYLNKIINMTSIDSN